MRVQTAQKAGQVLEIATIWDSFFLRHSKSDRLDKEPFAKRNVKGLQQGVESNGMSMGQMRAGAERGSVALACGPCVPRQRPIKAGRGGGLICDECYFNLKAKQCPSCRAKINDIVNLLDFYKANPMNDDWKHTLKMYSTQMKLQSFSTLQSSTQNSYFVSL